MYQKHTKWKVFSYVSSRAKTRDMGVSCAHVVDFCGAVNWPNHLPHHYISDSYFDINSKKSFLEYLAIVIQEDT